MTKLPTILLVLGAALMSAGLALVSIPAGVMLAGAFALVAGVLMLRGAENDERSEDA